MRYAQIAPRTSYWFSIDSFLDRYVTDACIRDEILLSKLPFKLDQYSLTPQVSTFLDIGSGFGKPNFHCAMQADPLESKGIEIVPQRVNFCMDQKCIFEE